MNPPSMSAVNVCGCTSFKGTSVHHSLCGGWERPSVLWRQSVDRPALFKNLSDNLLTELSVQFALYQLSADHWVPDILSTNLCVCAWVCRCVCACVCFFVSVCINGNWNTRQTKQLLPSSLTVNTWICTLLLSDNCLYPTHAHVKSFTAPSVQTVFFGCWFLWIVTPDVGQMLCLGQCRISGLIEDLNLDTPSIFNHVCESDRCS